MRRLPQTCGRVVSGLLALLLASAVALLASAQPAAAHGTLADVHTGGRRHGARAVDVGAAVLHREGRRQRVLHDHRPGRHPGRQRLVVGEPKPLDKPVREYFLVNGQFEPREYTTGFPAVVAVAHLPAKGQYSVSYLSVASDGDTVRGTLTFRYNGRVTAAPQGWSPPSTQPDPALVAATEQHNTSGQASAVPTTADDRRPRPAAAAPPTGSTAESGPGALAWARLVRLAVAAAGAVAGFVVWRLADRRRRQIHRPGPTSAATPAPASRPDHARAGTAGPRRTDRRRQDPRRQAAARGSAKTEPHGRRAGGRPDRGPTRTSPPRRPGPG